MEFYEYLREKESDLIDAIGIKNFKEEKLYFVNEVETLIEDYIKFKKLSIHNVMYWRDIDKEMPPEHEKVLVQLPYDVQLMAQMDSNQNWGIYWADGQKPMDNDRPVLKWMPLPTCT